MGHSEGFVFCGFILLRNWFTEVLKEASKKLSIMLIKWRKTKRVPHRSSK